MCVVACAYLLNAYLLTTLLPWLRCLEALLHRCGAAPAPAIASGALCVRAHARALSNCCLQHHRFLYRCFAWHLFSLLFCSAMLLHVLLHVMLYVSRGVTSLHVILHVCLHVRLYDFHS